MPEPVRAGQRYMPGLDGLRALAVLAVIAFHEQLGWAPGGLLGVGVFFTLSGYLITDLLLGQWTARGRLALADFWARRARRLLPALFVMLAVVTAWVTLFDQARLAVLRGADAAAATYSSNWYLIIQGQSYFARFAPSAAARPPVVAGRGGAVLPRLALAAAGRPAARPQGPPRPRGRCRLAGAADAGPGRLLGMRDARPVSPRPGPDPGVRGHRHPGSRAAYRRRAGDDLAVTPPRAAAARSAGCSTSAGLPGWP